MTLKSTKISATTKYHAVAELGVPIDITDKFIGVPKKEGDHYKVTFKLWATGNYTALTVCLSEPEKARFYTRIKLTKINKVEVGSLRGSNGNWYKNTVVFADCEPTDEEPVLIARQLQDRQLKGNMAEKPKAFDGRRKEHEIKKDTDAYDTAGIDAFLDALHDDDLSGVKSTDDELPFN